MQTNPSANQRVGRRGPISTFLILMSSILLCAQTSNSPGAGTNVGATSSQTTINPLGLPLQLRSTVGALGTRLQTPGQERATSAGVLTTSTTSGPATVTLELPNKLRVDGAGGATRSVVFDGTNDSASDANVTQQDEDLLETLLDDSAEGMLNAVLNTSSLRVIATFAKLGDGSGRLVDVFQVVGPVQSRTDKPVRQKHFYFDSITHLLIEVDYVKKRSDGSTAAVRVQRSNWTKNGGQMIPGSITRIEDGKPVTTFTVSNTLFSAKTNDGEFSPH